MIILAPVTLTQGEAISLLMTYRENNVGFDFTGWTGDWAIVQRETVMASAAMTLQTDGDMFSDITSAQIDGLDVTDQYRGRTLSETYWRGVVTNGTASKTFRAAVTVIRGVQYQTSDGIAPDGSLLVDDGNTLLAE